MAPGKRKASFKPKIGAGKKPKGPGQFKKSISEKKLPANPFELKFNRPKHNVLGAKRSMVGAPGASKKNAIDNRRKTLQIEYKHMGKVNQIVDKRFGEGDATMTAEEKAAKRFALQRSLATNVKKQHKNKFLLQDDEEVTDFLTHKGQTLTDVAKHDRTMVSDDEEDEDTGNLHRDVVANAHFGGGWMRKDGEGEEEEGQPRLGRKDMVMEMIARSKLFKQEKQNAKDEIEQATETLDEKWKSLLQSGNVSGFAPGINKHATGGVQHDTYDDLFRELQLNGGGRADPQDKMKSAKELASLEKERLEELERKRFARMNEEIEEDEEDEEDEAAEADEEEDECNSEEDEIEVEDFDAMGEPSDDETEDSKPVKATSEAEDSVVTDDPTLPYVFDLPQSYKQLTALFDGHTAHDQVLIIERVCKCHHPSLKEGNKQKLSKLFVHLLRFYDSLAASENGPSETKTLGVLLKPLYKLMKYDVDYAARAMRALLMNKKKKRGAHEAPSFAVIAFFQAVANLFPVSDKFHPVCSPSLAFAMDIISTSHVTSLKDCSRLLFLCTILCEWVNDSKRYMPEVIAFLRGLLLLAVNNSVDEQFPSTAFPISEPHRRMLFVNQKISTGVEPVSLSVVFSAQKGTSDALKASVVRSVLGTLNRYIMIYSNAHADSFCAIFKPFDALIERLPKDQYPEVFQTEISEFLSALRSECQKRSAVKHLHRVNNNIKMIEMLEPKVDLNFDPERATRFKDAKNDPNADRKRLQHKVKREFRGAVRELRKDAGFIARQKRTDRMRVDRERDEKTKKILHDLQFQESEHKKREYEKKYKRF
ncbi:hypothetical protein L596_018466 [Steinernema carpocapsae]|uniref:Nucleolar protein 14 n=1 Tax=Steinernema carpocapsae TaxID=34508 RepID=A0A4U5N4P5_STECR|nr:hypothetical protein L596_018466 [Steinernema carpocapsae]